MLEYLNMATIHLRCRHFKDILFVVITKFWRIGTYSHVQNEVSNTYVTMKNRIEVSTI